MLWRSGSSNITRSEKLLWQPAGLTNPKHQTTSREVNTPGMEGTLKPKLVPILEHDLVLEPILDPTPEPTPKLVELVVASGQTPEPSLEPAVVAECFPDPGPDPSLISEPFLLQVLEALEVHSTDWSRVEHVLAVLKLLDSRL